MKLSRKLFIKWLAAAMALLSFFVKKDLSRYNITIIDVIDAGRDSGETVLTLIDALKDRKLSPEEILGLVEKLTFTKRSLDKALTTLINDLKDYVILEAAENNTDYYALKKILKE